MKVVVTPSMYYLFLLLIVFFICYYPEVVRGFHFWRDKSDLRVPKVSSLIDLARCHALGQFSCHWPQSGTYCSPLYTMSDYSTSIYEPKLLVNLMLNTVDGLRYRVKPSGFDCSNLTGFRSSTLTSGSSYLASIVKPYSSNTVCEADLADLVNLSTAFPLSSSLPQETNDDVYTSKSYLKMKTTSPSLLVVENTGGTTYYDPSLTRFRKMKFPYSVTIFSWNLDWDETTNGIPQYVSQIFETKWIIFTTSGNIYDLNPISESVNVIVGGLTWSSRLPSTFPSKQLFVVYTTTSTIIYGLDDENSVIETYRFGEKLLAVHVQEHPDRLVIARTTSVTSYRFSRHPTLHTLILFESTTTGNSIVSKFSRLKKWGHFDASSFLENGGIGKYIVKMIVLGSENYYVKYDAALGDNIEFCFRACLAVGHYSPNCTVSKHTLPYSTRRYSVIIESPFTLIRSNWITQYVVKVDCKTPGHGLLSSSHFTSSSPYYSSFVDKVAELTDTVTSPFIYTVGNLAVAFGGATTEFKNVSFFSVDHPASSTNSIIGMSATMTWIPSFDVQQFRVNMPTFACNSSSSTCGITENVGESANSRRLLGYDSVKFVYSDNQLKSADPITESFTIIAIINATDESGIFTILSANVFESALSYFQPQESNISKHVKLLFPAVSTISSSSTSSSTFNISTLWIDNVDSPLHNINYSMSKLSREPDLISPPNFYKTVQDDGFKIFRCTEETYISGVGLIKYATFLESDDYSEKLSVLRCGLPGAGIIKFAHISSPYFNRTSGILPVDTSSGLISSHTFQPSSGFSKSFEKTTGGFAFFPPSSPCNSSGTRIDLVVYFSSAPSAPVRIPFILLPEGALVPDEYPSTYYDGVQVSTTTTASTTTIVSTSTTETPTTTSTTISGTTTITSTTTTTTTTTIQPTCPPGTYGLSTEGSVSCEQCPQGHYCSDSNQTSPTPCAAGSASSETSATSSSVCQICPAGSAASSGSIQCQLCLQGSYSSSSNSSQCTLAPLGKFVSGVGATSAISCPAGTSTSQLGAKDEADCVACTSGTYSTAGRACMNCSKGTFCAAVACSVCTSCSVGYFAQKEASRTCLPCPKETFASSPASVNCTSCGNGYTTNALTAQSLCIPIPPTTTLPYLTQIPPVIQYEPLPPSLNEFIASTTQTTTSSAPLSPGQTLPPAPFVDEISSKNSIDGIGTALKFLSTNPDSQGNPVATPPFTVTMSLADVSLGSFVVRSWLTSPQVVISSSNPPSFTVTITSNNATALSEAMKTAVLFNVAPRAKALNLTQSAKFLRVAVSDGSSSSSSAYASLMLDTLVENIGPLPTRLNNKNESERIIVNVSRGLKFDTSVGVIALHPQDLPLQVAVQQYDGSPLPSTMRCNCRVITIKQKRYVNCSAIGTLSQEYPLFTEALISDGYILKKISLVFVTQSIPLQISSLIVPPVYLRPGKSFEYQVPSGLFISSTEISYIKMNRAGGNPLPSSMNFVPNILRGSYLIPGNLLLEVVAEDLFTKLVRNITFVFTNNEVKCVQVVQRSSFNNENTTTATTATSPPPSITTTTTVNNTNNITSSSNSNYTLNTDGTASATSIIKPVVALREFERVVDLSSLCHDADAEDSLVYSVRSLPGASWSRAEIRQSTLTLSGSPPRTAGFLGQTFDILVEVTDTFQKIATELKLFLTVIQNTAPQLIKPLPELPVTPSESKTFVVLINEYYVDAQGDDMFVSASIAVGQTAPWLKISSSLNAQPATVTIEAEPEDNGESKEETIEVVVNVRDSLGNSSEPRTLKVKVVLTSWQKARYYVMVAASALASILGVVSMFWIIPYFFNICNRKNVVIPCPLSYDNQTFDFPDDTRECLFQIRAKHWYHKVLVCMPAFVRDDLSLDPTSDGSPPSWLKVEDHQVKLEIPNDASYEPRVPVITFRFFTRFGVLLCQFDVDYHEVTAGWIYGLDALLNDENASLSPEHLKQTSTHIISHQDSQQAQLRSDMKSDLNDRFASTKNEIYSAKSQVQRVEHEVLNLRDMLKQALDGGGFSPQLSSPSSTAAAATTSSKSRSRKPNNNSNLDRPLLIDDEIELDAFDLGVSNKQGGDDDLDFLLGNPTTTTTSEEEDAVFGKARFDGNSDRYKTNQYDTELEVLLEANAPDKKKKKTSGETTDVNPILTRLKSGTFVTPGTHKKNDDNTADDDIDDVDLEEYLGESKHFEKKTKKEKKSK